MRSPACFMPSAAYWKQGVSFSGGVGTVFGVVTGVIIFTVINYGLTYIGVNPYWQYIIKGGIIIFAVALDSLKYARKK